MTTVPTLAARLRAETRSRHAQAERAGIMPALLQGRMDRGAYVRLLLNLHAIYAALEAGLTQHADHPHVAPICFPALFRVLALRADLQVLAPGAPTETHGLCPATHAYVARLQHLTDHQPEGLVAHAYTRYLGDLSGGQMLGEIVARSLGLSGEMGVEFYRFGTPAEVGAHLQKFRAGLDLLPLDGAACDRVVSEAAGAFDRHIELFEELVVT